jgi:transcriptional antiterminator RfaH
MPILRKETVLFPDNLLDPGGLATTANFQWRVVYTKPRHEKSVARDLEARGVPFYLPLQSKTAYFRGRSITSLLPVFPSYIFLFVSDEDRDIAFKTNRIVSITDVYDGVRLRRELRQVRRLIESDVPITIESQILPGERVRVRLGPFAGMEGTVLTRRNETRLLVSIDFLQRGASFAIDDYMLESLSSPAKPRLAVARA